MNLGEPKEKESRIVDRTGSKMVQRRTVGRIMAGFDEMKTR